MTVLLEEKERYTHMLAATVKQMDNLFPESPLLMVLEQLRNDIANDYYMIVVVGEFNHGKSTLINALIGDSLMPMGIIPTTAMIHAIFYGEAPEMHIVKKDGSVERIPLTQNALEMYGAESGQSSPDIDYVKLFLPIELLKKSRAVIVDTPGINDVNKQRTAVTKRFIKQADTVLFTLNLRHAVNHSEYEFLETIQKSEGIQRIIYPANFKDQFEDEEVEDLIDYIERRIGNLSGGKRPLVLPVSAKLGMEGKLKNDPSLVEYSGIGELEDSLEALLKGGNRQQAKMERYRFRTNALLSAILEEVETVKALCEADVELLRESMDSIAGLIANKSVWNSELDRYIVERQEEMEAIVEKSILYFIERLKKEVEKRIALYNGHDIDHLMNTEIPITVQSRFEQWIDQYSAHIRELLVKLEQGISEGLSESFKRSITVKSGNHDDLEAGDMQNHIEVKSENTMLKAGLLVGGASSLAIVLGASLVIPVMGMVALPFVQNKLMKKKLAESKPDLQITMDNHISTLGQELMGNVKTYISTNVQTIRQHTMEQFEAELRRKKKLIDEQLVAKEKESATANAKIAKLATFRETIKQMINEVK